MTDQSQNNIDRLKSVLSSIQPIPTLVILPVSIILCFNNIFDKLFSRFELGDFIGFSIKYISIFISLYIIDETLFYLNQKHKLIFNMIKSLILIMGFTIITYSIKLIIQAFFELSNEVSGEKFNLFQTIIRSIYPTNIRYFGCIMIFIFLYYHFKYYLIKKEVAPTLKDFHFITTPNQLKVHLRYRINYLSKTIYSDKDIQNIKIISNEIKLLLSSLVMEESPINKEIQNYIFSGDVSELSLNACKYILTHKDFIKAIINYENA